MTEVLHEVLDIRTRQTSQRLKRQRRILPPHSVSSHLHISIQLTSVIHAPPIAMAAVATLCRATS
jgi:hypothetical protein